MAYDVVVIGGGLSGLTAAALLSKRGLKIAVVEKSAHPGGSCGAFKRHGVIYDQGAAMLFGFGEAGFNAHRFVFNCLAEPIDVIRHDLLYRVNFDGKRIDFHADLDEFIAELARAFPGERENIKRFYRDMGTLHQHVMVESQGYITPDETPPLHALRSLARHPVSYLKFLTLLNVSAESLLRRYFRDPEIFAFFDKLTSTYCYTTVAESPAILAAVMFVENHIGGSYYPAGSTLFLPGKLEKVIEEHDGDMLLGNEVTRIRFANGKPCGVELQDGRYLPADNIIYSGTVWNLYEKLLAGQVSSRKVDWARKQVPTYPSVVLYAQVDAGVIPPDTQPVEMLVGNPKAIDESEVTVYVSSIDDWTLCPEGSHVVVAIGPSFEDWTGNRADYKAKKDKELRRLLGVLERRFPGFTAAVRHTEVATPRTIERYTNKNGGAVAGPKQALGQHLLRRQHTRTDWDNLFCCGESTVMGTGTPTVTVSGIAAANAVLKKLGLAEFTHSPGMPNYVTVLPKPVRRQDLYASCLPGTGAIARQAAQCEYCEHPLCLKNTSLDIPGVMRRVTVGNLVGAWKLVEATPDVTDEMLAEAESRCIRNARYQTPVPIRAVISSLGEEVVTAHLDKAVEQEYDVIVVGGGVAGLTSAAYLSRAGLQVLLCEQADKTGGLLNSFTVGGFTFDGGIRAIENSGIVLPMLRQLGIDIEFRTDQVSIGIGDDLISLTSRDSLTDYQRLLTRLFPDDAVDVARITAEIRRVMGYMDVLYGIDNPLFRDLKNDREYLVKTVLPWLARYRFSINRALRIQDPIRKHLAKFTGNQSLIDMVCQHFFTDVPAFFALSYFSLYLDYRYPCGGTGVLAESLDRFIRGHGGDVRTGTEIVAVDAADRLVTTADGTRFRYRKLIWAADSKRLYAAVDVNSLADSGVRQAVQRQRQAVEATKGGDSILTVFLTVDLEPGYFEQRGGAHLFYTPTPQGLHDLDLRQLRQPAISGGLTTGFTSDKAAIFDFVGRYLDRTTYEIACPAVGDAAMAPAGQTGLIVSTLFDHDLVRHIHDQGWYEEFKEFTGKWVLGVLGRQLYLDLAGRVLHRFTSTPLTIARLSGNSGGAITGWSFADGPIPVERRFDQITNAIHTPIPDVLQAGQWTFSPSGLPVSILTGKLAADEAVAGLTSKSRAGTRFPMAIRGHGKAGNPGALR